MKTKGFWTWNTVTQNKMNISLTGLKERKQLSQIKPGEWFYWESTVYMRINFNRENATLPFAAVDAEGNVNFFADYHVAVLKQNNPVWLEFVSID